jgi:hypothetical protein
MLQTHFATLYALVSYLLAQGFTAINATQCISNDGLMLAEIYAAHGSYFVEYV